MTKKAATKTGGTMDFLASLTLPGDGNDPDISPTLVPIDNIEPDPKNIRADFRPIDGVVAPEVLEKLANFADEIHASQLNHPVSLIPLENGQYRLVIGERRWRAFKLNRDNGRPNYDRIPAYIRTGLSGQKLRLVQIGENLQREDPSEIDVAKGLKLLLEENPELQKQDLAKLLHREPSYISRLMGLLDPRYSELVDRGVITYSSLLEQFKALKPASQQAVVEKAQKAGRPITSGDLRGARDAEKANRQVVSQVGAGIQTQAAETLAAFRLESGQPDSYDPAHAKASREAAAGLMIRDTGAQTPVVPDVVTFDEITAAKVDLRLSLSQLAVLLQSDAIGREGLSVLASLALPVAAAKAAIEALGGKVPAQAHDIGPALISAINKQL